MYRGRKQYKNGGERTLDLFKDQCTEILAAGIIKRKRDFLISNLKHDFPTQDNIMQDFNWGYRFFLTRKKEIYIVIDIIITLCIYRIFQVIIIIIIIINLYLQFLIVYNKTMR
jgi:hypothetical protein